MSTLGHASTAETEKIVAAAAHELAQVGINMNLAPVADLCSADCKGAIGDRSFAENPALAAEHVAAAVRAIEREGIIACAKHFPGHGATAVDSHRDMPVVHLTIDELRANDLIPFRAAIAAGVEAIMTAHVMFPHAGDAIFPASLSSYWVRKVLREEMGFGGLVVTDAIEMDGLLKHYSPAAAGLAAIRAGADVLIYYRIEEQFRATYALRQAAIEGELDAGSLADSLARIARVKRRFTGSPKQKRGRADRDHPH
jgi:beta-N-acetylhexosaminidase